MTNDSSKNDCYSQGERRFMEAGQRLRAKLLAPVLRALSGMGVRPNHLTFLSFIAGISASAGLVIFPPFGLLFLAMHVFLDGLDGPLARYEKTDSNVGSFIDTISDQAVIVAVMLSLVHLNLAGPMAGMLYVVSYTVVVGFAFVRNALGIPYSWLFRPRFLVYCWIAIELYLISGSLSYVLWACNAVLLWKAATGFAKIRKKL